MMRTTGMKSVAVLALLSAQLALSQSPAAKKQVDEIGMVMLLAAPAKFDNHVVRTWGFLNLRADNDGLWLHEEDMQASLWKDSVAIDLTEEQRKQYQNLNHTYVMVEGVLHTHKSTSRALDSGTLVHITLMQGWQPYVPLDSKTK
jgi:hypothetical protein